jgi:hypothetical protein
MDDCTYALVTELVKAISLRLAQGEKSWRALVKAVMNNRVP